MKKKAFNRIFIFVLIVELLGFKATSFTQTLPVYQEESSFWIPSGWMPDGNNISVNQSSNQNPDAGKKCIEISINLKNLTQGWIGVYWLTHDSWRGPGVNIYQQMNVSTEASIMLTFRVRGKTGGERVQFKVGGISEGNDSIKFPALTKWLTLSSEWRTEKILLTTKDLSNVVGGFCMVSNKPRNPMKDEIVIYLDNIQFEVDK